MTKEFYLRLKPFEKKLDSAIRSNYVHFPKRDFDVFQSVYEEYYGKPLTAQEKSCSVCKLRAVQKIGKEYFAYIEWAKKFGRADSL